MKGKTFSFTLDKISVSAELQIMVSCISLTNFQHVLKSFLVWSQQQAVITVTDDTIEVSIDLATIATSSQEIEETIHVKTIEEAREYRALSNAFL